MNFILALLVAITITSPKKSTKLTITNPLVHDTCNRNRSQNSGPIFYVNKQKKGPFKVILHCKTVKRGQLTDGKSPNFVLRVFDPNDKSIAAQCIEGKNQEVKTIVVDLGDSPVGRYRLSLVGWFNNISLNTEPATDGIGIAGGDTLRIYPDKTYYLYMTGSSLNIKAAAVNYIKGKYKIVINDNASGKTLLDKEITNKRFRFTDIKLDKLKQGSLLKINLIGKGAFNIIINGTSPILWTTAKAALRAKGDHIIAGKRSVAHAWQKPMVLWLQNRKKEDFIIEDLQLAKFDSKDLKYLKYALNVNWANILSVGKSLMKNNQIIDPKDDKLGLFKDDKTKVYKFKQLGYALTLLALYDIEMTGLNPYYKNKQIKNRALAALCQIMLMVPENQFTTMDFVLIKFMGFAASVIAKDIDDIELKTAIKDGMLEFMSRNAYFDGYQSNQGLNIMVGLYMSQKLLKDKVLEDWYERYMAAMFNDEFTDVNHGQTPEGFYQERGGLDGGYNSYSTQLILMLWRKSNDNKYLQSLKKNFNFLRYVCVTRPDGSYTSAKQWNTRSSRPAYGNHILRAGYDIPECVTFILQGRKKLPYIDKLIKDLPHKLKATFKNKKLETKKFWTGHSAFMIEKLSDSLVKPLKLFCEIDGDFFKKLGNRYFVAKQGDFYAVFFSGDRWCVGDSGSGLANLWHKDFGSLILGNTKIGNKKKNYVLSLSETWIDSRNKRISSQYMNGSISQNANNIILDLKQRNQAGLRRTYNITAKGLTSCVVNNDKVWKQHELYLPLVSNQSIKLDVLDINNKVVLISETNPVKASAFRWTNKKGEQIELKLNTEYDVFLHTTSKYHKDNLHVMKIILGNKEGKFEIRRIEK